MDNGVLPVNTDAGLTRIVDVEHRPLTGLYEISPQRPCVHKKSGTEQCGARGYIPRRAVGARNLPHGIGVSLQLLDQVGAITTPPGPLHHDHADVGEWRVVATENGADSRDSPFVFQQAALVRRYPPRESLAIRDFKGPSFRDGHDRCQDVEVTQCDRSIAYAMDRMMRLLRIAEIVIAGDDIVCPLMEEEHEVGIIGAGLHSGCLGSRREAVEYRDGVPPVLRQEEELDDRAAGLALAVEDTVANECAAVPQPVDARSSLLNFSFVPDHIVELTRVQQPQIRDLVDRYRFDLDMHRWIMAPDIMDRETDRPWIIGCGTDGGELCGYDAYTGFTWTATHGGPESDGIISGSVPDGLVLIPVLPPATLPPSVGGESTGSWAMCWKVS